MIKQNLESNTFGDSKKYKMLPRLTELINSLKEEKHFNRIGNIIHEFHIKIKHIQDIEDNYVKNYVLDLVHNDYKELINSSTHLYENNSKLLSYLMNYISAVIKNNKQNNG